VCDEEAADGPECVGCLLADDCTGNPNGTLCDTDAKKCVECLELEDCTEADAALCDAGTCKPCAEDNDCDYVEGKGICNDGLCVACTVDDESACEGNSCNPQSHECTETQVGSKEDCEACVADSECPTDYRCVQMEFNGAPREGGYCLKVLSTGCEKPYGVPTDSLQSLSGADATTYCGLNETQTTCEAVRGLLTTCATDDGCGVAGLADGLCKNVNGFNNTCTYSCTLASQCPDEAPCNGPAGAKYCGAP
jgi:hypothetical protein